MPDDWSERCRNAAIKMYEEHPEIKEKQKGPRKDFIPWNKGKHGLYKHSKETKQLLKEKFSSENNPMYGKSLYDFMSDDKIQSWKQSLKGRTAWNKGLHTRSGENNPMYGKGTRIWVNNGTNNHLIKISEKDKYLNNGYSLGKK